MPNLAFELKEPGLMQRPPRDPRKPLLTFALAMRTGLVSILMLAGAYWLFFWEIQAGGNTAAARTGVINVIVLVEIAYLLNCRSLNHSFFSVGLFSNPWLVSGVLAMLAAQLLFTYVPLMNTLFHTAPISGESWLRIMAVAAVVFVVVEIEKWLRYGRGRGDHGVPE